MMWRGFPERSSRASQATLPQAFTEEKTMLDISPGTKIDTILAKLGEALASGDIDAAVNLFQAECYWRDLVTFTWNL